MYVLPTLYARIFKTIVFNSIRNHRVNHASIILQIKLVFNIVY